jgi:triosephosphate isomerase
MTTRKPLISGNWKMNYTHLDAIAVVQKLTYTLLPADYDRADVSVHPSFTALRSVQTMLDADGIPIALGAQDVHPAESGAFTGEVSPSMLAKLNVRYVIVGHSERREHFGDTDAFVNQKLLAVLKHEMIPILCSWKPPSTASPPRRRRAWSSPMSPSGPSAPAARPAPTTPRRCARPSVPGWPVITGQTWPTR